MIKKYLGTQPLTIEQKRAKVRKLEYVTNFPAKDFCRNMNIDQRIAYVDEYGKWL